MQLHRLVFSAALIWSITNSVQAGEARLLVTLPASQIPASEDDPPCGNTDLEAQTADTIIKGITGAIDYYTGLPFTGPTIQALGGAGWVLPRLGLHNGKSSCITSCVITPLDSKVERYQACMSGAGDKPQACFYGQNASNANGGLAWGRLMNATISQKGRAQLFCVTAKNWSHDTSRDFLVIADW